MGIFPLPQYEREDVPYAFCGSLTRSFTVLDDIMKASLAFTDKCCVRVSNLTDLAL